mmetsp:Transcript_492/g.945  ORF Transcript_492/g.945 Transcript_492/m.945 type:complete len:295 (+) Transcript_492:469-1353(+)
MAREILALVGPGLRVRVVDVRAHADHPFVQKAAIELLDHVLGVGRSPQLHNPLLVVAVLVQEDLGFFDLRHAQHVRIQVLQLHIRVNVIHENRLALGFLLLHVLGVVGPDEHPLALQHRAVELQDSVLGLLGGAEFDDRLAVHPRGVPHHVDEVDVARLLEVVLHILPDERRVERVHENFLLNVLRGLKLAVELGDVVLPDLDLPPAEAGPVEALHGGLGVGGRRELDSAKAARLFHAVDHPVLDVGAQNGPLGGEVVLELVLGRAVGQVRHEETPLAAQLLLLAAALGGRLPL